MPECELGGEKHPEEFITAELKTIAEKTAEAVMEKLKSLSFTLALAESCTAGLISALLVNTSGASENFWGSFVCYKQEAKVAMLGLNNETLAAQGIVSRETVCSMAAGVLQKSGADITAAITGFVGPNGDDKVRGGTIWIAVAKRDGEMFVKEFHFYGSRNTVRIRAAIAVLEEILKVLPQ